MNELDLARLNKESQDISVEDRIRKAMDRFPRIVATSSFGEHSALMLYFLSAVAPNMPIIFVNTGKLTAETLKHRDNLENLLGINVITYGTRNGETKDDALGRAFAEQGAEAWISAVMYWETEHRNKLSYINMGERYKGLVKINPVIDWSKERMLQFFAERNLPLNLNYIDPDKPEKKECGIQC